MAVERDAPMFEGLQRSNNPLLFLPEQIERDHFVVWGFWAASAARV